MGFGERLLKDIKEGKEINGGRYLKTYKERAHISASELGADSAEYLEMGDVRSLAYGRGLGKRYVVARDITYDLVLSLYEINSSTLSVLRMAGINDIGLNERAIEGLVAKTLGKIPTRRRSIEARIIGMQSGQDFYNLAVIPKFLEDHKIPVVEMDVFGNQTRHIALDSSVGTSFDVLMLDRLYRAGELNNTRTQEQFEGQLKKDDRKP